MAGGDVGIGCGGQILSSQGGTQARRLGSRVEGARNMRAQLGGGDDKFPTLRSDSNSGIVSLTFSSSHLDNT